MWPAERSFKIRGARRATKTGFIAWRIQASASGMAPRVHA
jgi:hypothetical protein